MKMDRLNQWLTLVANIGVIAGILALTVEISQNSQMMKSQTRAEISRSVSDMLLLEFDSDYIRVLVDGQDLTHLDPIDRQRVINLRLAQFRIWENMHYQYRNRLYDEAEFVKEREAWRINMQNAATRQIYCDWRQVFSDAFVAEMNALLATPCTDSD